MDQRSRQQSCCCPVEDLSQVTFSDSFLMKELKKCKFDNINKDDE